MPTRVAFVIGQYPPDQRKLREDTAKRYSSAEVEVGIIGVPLTPFNELLPAEVQQAAPYFQQAFVQAEREGYDAVVPLGALARGLRAGHPARRVFPRFQFRLARRQAARRRAWPARGLSVRTARPCRSATAC